MNQTNTFLGTEEQPLVTPTSDEKTMAILSHILCLVAGFIAPLVIYLVKKDSPYVTAHAKESLNFQLTMLIAVIVSVILMIVLIGFLLLWLLGIANLVLIIIATIRASENKMYRYPVSIRFIK
jgi:uncharacterized Tic20 family protein